MIRICEFTIGGESAPWQALGLRVVDDRCTLHGVTLQFDAQRPAGLHGWGWDAPVPSTIDGVDTTHAIARGGDDSGGALGVTGWDHVVVMTSSLERTCAAVESSVDAPLRRIREAGAIRQGFHRAGPMIVEVVESAAVTADVAALWGFVWIVADLDAEYERLGEALLSVPKPAVQPGRHIATVRAGAGLGVPLALMSS